MAYTNIDDPSAYFQTTTYTGNGANGHVITHTGNSDLQADMVWIKMRSAADFPAIYDTNRRPSGTPFSGSLYMLAIGNNYGTGTENTGAYGPTAIGSDSVTMNQYDTINKSSETFVSWNWKANGGTTSNLSGNLASVVQVNQDAGFSIVKYTGSGGNGQSVNHGLGLVPEVIITKARNGTGDWYVYHKSIGTANFLKLNTAAAQAGSSPYAAADPTSTAFFVSNSLIYVGELGANFISYVFSSIQGYSKFGKYVGNGSGTNDTTFDGAFVYLGFKPAWLLIKRSSYSAGDGWNLFDNTRPPRGGSTTGNYNQNKLNPASDAAESGAVYDSVDFLSNGFKLRSGRAGVNASGSTYIYMAFAENPFVTSTGIPTTAR